MTVFAFITPTWDGLSWATAMQMACPGKIIRIWPEIGELNDVTYAAAWLPPANILRSLPNLRVIFSLGAGVDAILSDPTLPDGIPIVRVNDPDLTNRMSEYIVLHVLMHHRQHDRLQLQQHNKLWDNFKTHAASALTVGIMGLGVMGTDAATKLRMLGFNVIGWSRTPKQIAGVTCYASAAEFDAFLGETDILVSLLPATKGTDGIINRALINKLSRRGPLGAPVLINAGRGSQQNENDILAALDAGELHAVSLDVFRKEPLPASSPLWSHPRVTLTPHAAADSEPTVICEYISRQIVRFEAGLPLENVVDRKRGY